MKLYRRAEFLKLPEGTMYFSGQPHAYSGLCVKGETWTNDWLCLNLDTIDMGKDSGELMERLDQMLETGASYPLNAGYGRDGGFDDTECFLVFERDDLNALIEHCRRAISATGAQSDEERTTCPNDGEKLVWNGGSFSCPNCQYLYDPD